MHFISGESLHRFLVGANKSSVIATSDLWLFIHASNLLPSLPTPLPYKCLNLYPCVIKYYRISLSPLSITCTCVHAHKHTLAHTHPCYFEARIKPLWRFTQCPSQTERGNPQCHTSVENHVWRHYRRQQEENDNVVPPWKTMWCDVTIANVISP